MAIFRKEDAKKLADALIESDSNGTVFMKYGLTVFVTDEDDNKLEEVNIDSRFLYIEDRKLEEYNGLGIGVNVDKMRNNRGRVVKRRLYNYIYKKVNHNLIMLENGIEEDNRGYLND